MAVSEKFLEAGRKNRQEWVARKRAESAPRRAAEQLAREERQRRILINRLRKAMKRYVNFKEKEALRNQHGIAVGDYDRCKRLNGTACEPCRAIVAKYVSDKWATDPKYKSKEKEWRKNNPHKRKANNKDRARRRGTKMGYYTRQQIFDRDGYNCYLCNIPVDLTATHIQGQPGWETYPHVEHVVPLALGGEDTLQNVKIAHAKCNMDKGVSLLATA
jgi:5-methylcytosine-specific restriction endonuclease McrA